MASGPLRRSGSTDLERRWCAQVAVVFESMYGVTHEVAEAIAAGDYRGPPDTAVTCLRVGDADPARVAAADTGSWAVRRTCGACRRG